MKEHTHHENDVKIKNQSQLSQTRMRFTVEFSKECVMQHAQHALHSLEKQVKLPGFRPGKAPVDIVKKQYQEEITQRVRSHLLEYGISYVAEAAKVNPISTQITDISENILPTKDPLTESSFSFVFEFDHLPKFELAEYKSIPVTSFPNTIEDSECDQTLENLRDRSAELEPISDTTPTPGLCAVVELEPVSLSANQKKNNPFLVELGKDKLPTWLESALFTMTVGGDWKEIYIPDSKIQSSAVSPQTLSSPPALEAPPTQGASSSQTKADIVYRCRILELKKKKLPELNDAWAKTINPEWTLEVLKQKIQEELLQEKQRLNQERKKDQIAQYLLAHHQIEVPQSALAQEVERQTRDYKQEMQKTELSPQEEDGIRRKSEDLLRLVIVTNAVAKKESIKVDPKKLDDKIVAYCKRLKKDPITHLPHLKTTGIIDVWHTQLLFDEVLTFLLSYASEQPSAPTMESAPVESVPM